MAQVTLLPILLGSLYEPGFKEKISKVASIARKISRNDACNVVLKSGPCASSVRRSLSVVRRSLSVMRRSFRHAQMADSTEMVK